MSGGCHIVPDSASPHVLMWLCPLRGSVLSGLVVPELWNNPFCKKKQHQNHFIYINYKKKKNHTFVHRKNLLLKTWLGSKTWVLLLALSLQCPPGLCRGWGQRAFICPRSCPVSHKGMRSATHGEGSDGGGLSLAQPHSVALLRPKPGGKHENAKH